MLTNAMLFTGRRARSSWRGWRAGRGSTLQSSIDGARAETHDLWRGAGLVGARDGGHRATRGSWGCRCAWR